MSNFAESSHHCLYIEDPGDADQPSQRTVAGDGKSFSLDKGDVDMIVLLDKMKKYIYNREASDEERENLIEEISIVKSVLTANSAQFHDCNEVKSVNNTLNTSNMPETRATSSRETPEPQELQSMATSKPKRRSKRLSPVEDTSSETDSEPEKKEKGGILVDLDQLKAKAEEISKSTGDDFELVFYCLKNDAGFSVSLPRKLRTSISSRGLNTSNMPETRATSSRETPEPQELQNMATSTPILQSNKSRHRSKRLLSVNDRSRKSAPERKKRSTSGKEEKVMYGVELSQLRVKAREISNSTGQDFEIVFYYLKKEMGFYASLPRKLRTPRSRHNGSETMSSGSRSGWFWQRSKTIS